MIRLINIYIFCFLIINVKGQSSDTAYIHLFGGKNMDMFRDGIATPDTGIIAVGTTSSYGAGNTDIYVVKTDSLCNKIWSKTYGRNNVEQGYCIKNTMDGGYIIAGFTNSIGSGGYDAYLIKIDANSQQLWERTYGGNDWDFAYSIVELPDSGFAVCGETYTNSFGNSDVYLFRTDKNGNIIWQKNIGGTQQDVANDLILDTDTNLVLVGKTKSFGNGQEDMYLIKTNLLGDTIWTKTFGDTLNECGYRLIQTQDLGYVIVGYAESYSPEGDKDIYLLKTDSGSNYLWQHTIGNAIGFDEATSISELNNGELFISGNTINGAGLIDIFSYIATNGGWWTPRSSSYGSIKLDNGFKNLIANNKYYVFGKTESYGQGNIDALIIRLDTIQENQNQQIVSNNDSLLNIEKLITQTKIAIYPNPFTNDIYIEIPTYQTGLYNYLEIYNLFGEIILSQKIVSNKLYLRDEISHLSKGMYFLQISSYQNNQSVTLKLLKQ